jgi:hypothetical protein
MTLRVLCASRPFYADLFRGKDCQIPLKASEFDTTSSIVRLELSLHRSLEKFSRKAIRKNMRGDGA